MDEANIKSWVSQPDACRCCLSTSGTWDLTASYISATGIKEVYSDMIQECYGISISYLSEWGPSHLVCTLCVSHLRDATSFRKQVLKAEQHLMEYFNSTKDSAIVKEEYLESPCQDDIGKANENIYKMIETDALTTTTKIHTNLEREHRTRKRPSMLKRKRKKSESDCDSDVPISELSKKKEPKDLGFKAEQKIDDAEQSRCKLNENELKDVEDKVDIKKTGKPHTVRPKNGVKQISERKRIILTCAIILKETTACPFRHHKSWFQCFFCSQDFMDITSLRHHTEQNHHEIDAELKKMKRYPRSLQIDISNLECRHCRVILTDVEAMRRHFESVHNKIIFNECVADYKVNSSPYTCHICSQQYHVFRTLTTHLNEHYANCICDVCGRSFINSKRLKVHKRTHENGSFPCNECGKILKTKTSKANHIESAHSKRIIKCQICFKPMKHYNHRIKHMSEVHNITHKFRCPICCKEYNIKHYLATHMRQTHGNKNKICLECGMAFITNHALKNHMVKHTGLKPFSCSVCSKSYSRSYTLKEHMRQHESGRRFLGVE